MEALIFDNDTVKAHRLYPCFGSTLYKVSKKDYKNDDFFDKSIECIDVDSYETARCAGHTSMDEQPTADAAIGVRKHLGGGRFSKKIGGKGLTVPANPAIINHAARQGSVNIPP